MWCCKDSLGREEIPLEDFESKPNDGKDVVDEKYIREWNLTLRENVICLDEHNVQVKRMKIEEQERDNIARSLEREQELDMRETDLDQQQEYLDAARKELEAARAKEQQLKLQEQEMKDERQSLRDSEAIIRERHAVLEIVVKLDGKEKKSNVTKVEEVDTTQETADWMLVREIQLEEREEALTKREQEIEQREFEINEKNAVFEVAIRVKQQLREDNT